MEWYSIKMNNEYLDVYNSIMKVESYIQKNFVHIYDDNGFLCGKKGGRTSFIEIFAENGYELIPLRIIFEQNGILESDISHVQIEDGKLVITTKDFNQIKI